MLIWLATFFGASLVLVFAVRWGFKRVRQRRTDRIKEIQVRCRQIPEALALPLGWRVSPATSDAADYRWAQMLLLPLPLGLFAAGLMWTFTGRRPLNWNGFGFGVAASSLTFAVLSAWISWRRETSMPRQARQVALALRCWAIRMDGGMDCRTALDQSAKQLRRIDPEIARVLELAAVSADSEDVLRQILAPCGTGLAERLAAILSGKVSDVSADLRTLANQLDSYYLNQLLSRTRLVESWLKYPLALCLVPALNLILFSPAITNLIEKFGKFRTPEARQAQPAEPISAEPVPDPDVPAAKPE